MGRGSFCPLKLHISKFINTFQLLKFWFYLIITIVFQTSEDFRQRLENVLRSEGYEIDRHRYPEGYQEAPLAYDAVWAVAMGIKPYIMFELYFNFY